LSLFKRNYYRLCPVLKGFGTNPGFILPVETAYAPNVPTAARKYGLSEEPLLKRLWVNSKTFVVKRLKTIKN
jgi:hypothetical protein